MNICVFSIVTVYHGIVGGMEIHEKMVSEELVKQGHQVSIISTRIGWNPSVIEENKDGLLINSGDIQSLSSKILYLLENSEEALRLAENVRKKVEEKFNLKKMLNDTIQVFVEALQLKDRPVALLELH
jgi:glycosyltransferase involved in cell wall biosynthesis